MGDVAARLPGCALRGDRRPPPLAGGSAGPALALTLTQHTKRPRGAYGFPPGMDARLEGRPGALMGGCGSKPTCRETHG